MSHGYNVILCEANELFKLPPTITHETGPKCGLNPVKVSIRIPYVEVR